MEPSSCFDSGNLPTHYAATNFGCWYVCDSKAFRNFHRLCLGGHIFGWKYFFYLETANEKGFRDNYCKKILIMQ